MHDSTDLRVYQAVLVLGHLCSTIKGIQINFCKYEDDGEDDTFSANFRVRSVMTLASHSAMSPLPCRRTSCLVTEHPLEQHYCIALEVDPLMMHGLFPSLDT